MLKEEIVLREILCQFMSGQKNLTQAHLSRELEVSLGMVNKTLSKLRQIGAARIGLRSFTIIDYNRILLYWSTIRNIERDVIYSTRVNLSVQEIERSAPAGVTFTAYTGSRLSFTEVPADYSEVWLYTPDETLEELRRRFRKNNLPRNLIVLRSDYKLADSVRKFSRNNNSVTIPQLYVDLWNIPTWYSKEFFSMVDRRIKEEVLGILEQ